MNKYLLLIILSCFLVSCESNTKEIAKQMQTCIDKGGMPAIVGTEAVICYYTPKGK